MIEKTIKLYDFSELNEAAKQKAKQDFIKGMQYYPPFEDDRCNAIEAINKALNLTYFIDAYENYHFNSILEKDISGARRVISYLSARIDINDAYNCRLSGTWMDCVYYDAYIEFIEYARKHPKTVLLKDFLYFLGKHFTRNHEETTEDWQSEEYIKEAYADVLFYPNGSIYEETE